MSAEVRPQGSFRALGAIVASALILQVASTIVHMVVPLRMAVAEQPPLLIGLVGSAYSVGFLTGCFRVPGLVRRIGHIRGFAVFAALQAALTLGFPLSSMEWWGLWRFGMGAAAAGLAICIESWISGQARSSHRGRIFGIYQILNRLALIGSQIGVGYVALKGQDIFLLASAGFSLALIPVGLTRARGPESPEVVSVRLRTLWRNAPAAVVGCLYVGMASGPLLSVTPAYGVLVGLDQKAAIWLTAAVQIGALLSQWPMGLLADRLDSRIIMLSSAILAALAGVALLAVLQLGLAYPQRWQYGLFGVIGAAAVSLYTVAVTHAYSKMGRDQALGLSAGLLFLWAVGSALGPLLATGFMQAVGPQGLVAYLVLLSAFVAVFLVIRLFKRPPAGTPGPDNAVRPPAIPDIAPGAR